MVLAVMACAILHQRQSLLSQVFPSLSGDNGYEEYLQAADVITTPDFVAYDTWISAARSEVNAKSPTGLLANASLLQGKQFAASKFARALDLLKAGNAKPVRRGANSTGVENKAFMKLAQFACDSASVRFAKGSWSDGVGKLLEVAAFGRHVAASGEDQWALGSEIIGLAMKSLGENQSRWSVQDCEKIKVWTSELRKQWGSLLPEKLGATPDVPKYATPYKAEVLLSLLEFDASIQEFKWRNGRLPYRISEIVPPSESIHYELKGDGTFRLYGDGLPSTGPIDFPPRPNSR